MKIHPVGAEFFHAEGRADEANCRFMSKNWITAESISLNLFWLKSMKTAYPHFPQIIRELLYKLKRPSHS